MKFREGLAWLGCAILAVLWLQAETCKRCPDSVTTTDTVTVYKDTGTTRIVTVPKPVNVFVPTPAQVDSFFIAANVDTVALMADYFTTRSYILTWDTNEVKLGIRFQVHQNRIRDSLTVTVSNVRPTTVIT